MKKDNSTLSLKVSLRKNILREIDRPIVFESHAGYGSIFSRCYTDVEFGIAVERNSQKAEYTAIRRPNWSVYEADCVSVLETGIAGYLGVNFLDCDPYGDPWHVVDAFLSHNDLSAERIAIVVNDGLRQKIKLNGGLDVASMRSTVQRYGASNIYRNYLEICQEMMEEKTAQLGYSLRRWAGYYCGHCDQMTHYAGVFER